MTHLAILADPPREGLVLPEIAAGTPLSAAEAVDLYEASLKDVIQGAAKSGAEVIVNYRPDDLLPAEHRRERSAEAAVRAVVAAAIEGIEDDPHVEEPRYEVQVGANVAARVGNTVTHLLSEEGASSAAVCRPTAPLVGRQVIDSAAMKLRRADVALGPAPGGRTYYAGFCEPIDFAEAYEPPELATLTDRSIDAGLSVDYTELLPTVETPDDLASTVAMVRARTAADRPVPEHTARFVAESGLTVAGEGDEAAVVRE